jgi:hypothetical protein
LDAYGKLTEANIQAHAMTYIVAQNRNAQQAAQMYAFLFNSLEDDIKTRVTNEPTRYTIVHNGRRFHNGPLFFKAITTLVCVDTASTIADVHAQLHALDVYMRTKVESCNIEKFNTHVRYLRTQLSNRAEVLSDSQLKVCIFNGYMACSDQEFVQFMTNVKNQTLYQNAMLSSDDVMTLALHFYTDRERHGQWNKLSPDKEQIVALTAELRSLQQKGRSGGKHGNKDGKDKKGKGKGNGKGKKGKGKRPEWMTTPPATGEKHEKVVKDKTYYWCPNHEMWTVHKPDDCKGIGASGKQQHSSSDDNKPKQADRNRTKSSDTRAKKLHLAKALHAIVEATGSDDEDSD